MQGKSVLQPAIQASCSYNQEQKQLTHLFKTGAFIRHLFCRYCPDNLALASNGCEAVLKSLLPNRLNELPEVRIELLFNWIGKSTKANHGTDSNPGTLVKARNKDFGTGLQRYLTRLVVLFVCSLPLASFSKKYLMKPQRYVYYSKNPQLRT